MENSTIFVFQIEFIYIKIEINRIKYIFENKNVRLMYTNLHRYTQIQKILTPVIYDREKER